MEIGNEMFIQGTIGVFAIIGFITVVVVTFRVIDGFFQSSKGE